MLPEPVHHVFAAGTLSAAMFFSAETAKTCVRLLQAARLDHTVATVDALAIGQSTAVALQPLPWRRIRVAAQPNQDAMLALLR
jgi:uroporphyrinogen-III synthase